MSVYADICRNDGMPVDGTVKRPNISKSTEHMIHTMERCAVTKPPKLEVKLFGCAVSAEGLAGIIGAVVIVVGFLVFSRF